MTNVLRFLPLVCVGTSASGAEFGASMDLGVVHTDNVAQATFNPESETLLQVVPSLSLAQDSRRFKTDAVYRMEAYHYDKLGETEVFNQFDAEFQAAIVPDRFFFNLGGMRGQAIVDPEATIPIMNFVLSSNRVDVDEYHAGPSFTFGAGGNAVVNGNFQRAWYRYDDQGAAGESDHLLDTASLSVDNYRKGTGATWAARFGAERADYELEPIPYEHRQASLELGFWLNSLTRLFVSGGKESPWDNPLETGLEDSFWEAGAARESERFSAEVAAGERSFGSSRRGEFTFNFNRGNSRLAYSETPTTNSQDRFRIGGLLNPEEEFNYLDRINTLERYIANRLEWNLSIDLERVGIALGLFDEEREERTDVSGVVLGDETQTGGDVSVTWKFGGKLSLVASGRRIEREFADAGADDITTSSLAANYQLGSRTKLAVQFSHWEQSDQEGGLLAYKSNVLQATVTRTFR
jgi:hypothetical protein